MPEKLDSITPKHKNLIPSEKPTPEEKKAIEENGEVADEEELMKALGKTAQKPRG